MEKVKDLYPQIPPTVLRQRDEKERTAKNVPFWHFIADIVFPKMVQNRFYSLIYKDEENLKKRNPNYATICYTPHCNWWDGIFAYYITRKLVKGKFRLMIEEMNRFPLFQYIGCFPVNKKSAQSAMKALKYSVDLLSDLKNVLCIFPQGIIRPPHYRPIEFQTGLAYIADKAVKKYGKVALLPIAVNYMFLRDNRPEVLVEFGELIEYDKAPIDRKEATQNIGRILESLCDKQMYDISRGNFKGYETLFQQKLKWYRRIEQRLKKIEPKNSGV